MTSLLVAGLLLVGATVLLTAGSRIAVYRRARDDYRDTRGKVVGAHKAFWRAWREIVIVAFWLTCGAILLLAWIVHDVRKETVLAPQPTVSTKAK